MRGKVPTLAALLPRSGPRDGCWLWGSRRAAPAPCPPPCPPGRAPGGPGRAAAGHAGGCRCFASMLSCVTRASKQSTSARRTVLGRTAAAKWSKKSHRPGQPATCSFQAAPLPCGLHCAPLPARSMQSAPVGFSHCPRPAGRKPCRPGAEAPCARPGPPAPPTPCRPPRPPSSSPPRPAAPAPAGCRSSPP
jgi:hypothetical protein